MHCLNSHKLFDYYLAPPRPKLKRRQTIQVTNILPVPHQPSEYTDIKPLPDKNHKQWHECMTQQMRRNVIEKIMDTVFPNHDPRLHKDRALNLVNCAVKIESEIYEYAEDQDQYFRLIAERVCKMQREFHQKRRQSHPMIQKNRSKRSKSV
jgi:hypothetical protein